MPRIGCYLVLGALGAALGGSRAAAQAGTPPAGVTHRIEARVVDAPPRESRVRGDTLWWILPRPALAMPNPADGFTDSVVVLFDQDSVFRLDGRRRLPFPAALWPLLREARAVVADSTAGPPAP